MEPKKSEIRKQCIKDGYVERRAIQFIEPLLPTFKIQSMTPVSGNDVWDVVITSGETNQQFTAKVEVKVKTCPLEKFKDWGAVIPKKKYYDLRKSTTNTEIPIYINVHSDGIAVWNLNEVEPEVWTEQLYRKNNLPDSPAEIKEVGNLRYENALQIKKVNIPLDLFRDKSEWYYEKHKHKISH